MDAAICIKEVEKNGYVLIKSGNDEKTVAELLAKIKHYYETLPGPSTEAVPFLNRGHQMLYNAQGKDLYFVTAMLRQKLVTQILCGLLNDQWYKQIPAENPNYILRSMIARNGGEAALPLHIDSFIPSAGEYCWSAQVSFILEDQNEKNGCTIVVPGSHKFGRYANQDALKDAVPIISEAGDILVWDSRLWHGTRGNTASGTRWALISTFTRWWIKQNYQITETFPPQFYSALTEPERAVIGFCSKPPRDEYERIDIKGGYEILPPAL